MIEAQFEWKRKAIYRLAMLALQSDRYLNVSHSQCL